MVDVVGRGVKLPSPDMVGHHQYPAVRVISCGRSCNQATFGIRQFVPLTSRANMCRDGQNWENVQRFRLSRRSFHAKV